MVICHPCGCVSLDGKGESVDFDLVLGSTRGPTKDHHSHMQPERVFIFWEQKFQHAGVYCSVRWQPPKKHTGSFQTQQGEFQGGEVSLGTDWTKSLQVVLGLVGTFSSERLSSSRVRKLSLASRRLWGSCWLAAPGLWLFQELLSSPSKLTPRPGLWQGY